MQPATGGITGSTLSSGGTGRRDLFTDFNAMQTTIESFGRFSYNLNSDTVFSAQSSRHASLSILAWARTMVFRPALPAPPRPTTFAVTNPYLSAANQAAIGQAGNPGCPGGDADGHRHCARLILQLRRLHGDPGWRDRTGLSGRIRPNELGREEAVFPRFNYRAIDREYGGHPGPAPVSCTGRWDWDLYYQHDESREKEVATGQPELPGHLCRGRRGFSWRSRRNGNGKPVCYVSTTQFAYLYPNCDPINPFGPTTLTATQYASFTHQTQYTMTNGMDDLGGSVAGNIFNLPAGPIKAALSGEARWLAYQVVCNADPVLHELHRPARLATRSRRFGIRRPWPPSRPKSELVYEVRRRSECSPTEGYSRWCRICRLTWPAATRTTACPARSRPGRSASTITW